MKNVVLALALFSLGACEHVTIEAPFSNEVKHQPIDPGNGEVSESATASLVKKHTALINRYFDVYKSKDVSGMLALFDDDIIGALYPATLFGRGIDAAQSGIEGDFESRPHSYVEDSNRFRIAADQWVVFGQSINGDERAPIWILLDLNEKGDAIEATYTQIAHSSFVEGMSVDEPTDAMKAAFTAMFDQLAATDFGAASGHFADDAALYAYPPADLENHTPIITGASDVASVLAFKWGEGAWRGDTFIARYMQFVFVGIPPKDQAPGLDRVALFTFDADPDSSSYEKIIRVDVMGPSGG